VWRFNAYGHVKRKDAQCPICGAVERHRFTWSFFEKLTNLFDGTSKRMLHIAPEPAFERRIRLLAYVDYVTADQQDAHADVAMDITKIQFPDNSFDVIHCSHVLEHVQEDLKAIREIARVLRPTGWATILVPISSETTFDDPSVTDPQERARLFGQWDHVRAYGQDFMARLESQGLSVRRVSVADVVAAMEEQADIVQFKAEELFLCTKAAPLTDVST
jgi:SAM-dependent methyltransferase